MGESLDARLKEIDALRNLIRKLGMDTSLEVFVSAVKDVVEENHSPPDPGEVYLMVLLRDLLVTQRHYILRYSGDPDS